MRATINSAATATKIQDSTERQAFGNHFMAERVGFEPTNTREDVTGIPVQRLRPLGHLSDQALARTFSKSSNSRPAGHAALARARMIHRHACGGVCFGALKGGGSSRQRSLLLRGGGAGVFSAGMCKALAVSGVSSPGGIFRGAMLADFM